VTSARADEVQKRRARRDGTNALDCPYVHFHVRSPDSHPEMCKRRSNN
jgi:hypothetical protein